MKRFIILWIFAFISMAPGLDAAESYRFRVYLKDKGKAGYTIDKPEEFLSEKAIRRRLRQGRPIDATDLPIAPAYLDTLAAAGGQPVVQSKWFATVVVSAADSLVAERLSHLSIVDSVKWVWKGDWDANRSATAGRTADEESIRRVFDREPVSSERTGGDVSVETLSAETVLPSAGVDSSSRKADPSFADADSSFAVLGADARSAVCAQSVVVLGGAAGPASVVTQSVPETDGGTDESEEVRFYPSDALSTLEYGYADDQIRMLNGIKLHKAGFRGEGMEVAVIDAGFMHVDRIAVFDSLKIAGTHNVVFPGETVFTGDDHGTKVLSCLAADRPGIMIGTAPKASYWLIKSEDSRSEFPVEEDYWTAAVEFADSVGADVVTSSLGYFTFDVEALDYPTDALNGKTTLISRAAKMAADKGILLFSSAGNEGAGTWGKITFPADAPDILTVGAITDRKRKSSFSSVGFTADRRVKPDVVALGSGCCVIDPSGNVHYANGTSFATPILAGLGVCLWQAFPALSNIEIVALLQRSGSQYKRPDAELGYGLPDVYKIYKQQRKHGGRRNK